MAATHYKKEDGYLILALANQRPPNKLCCSFGGRLAICYQDAERTLELRELHANKCVRRFKRDTKRTGELSSGDVARPPLSRRLFRTTFATLSGFAHTCECATGFWIKNKAAD